jgi:hypothetical protein
MTMATGSTTCPRCGMAREQWQSNRGQGVRAGGATYCCQGCADNTGCTCTRVR